MIVMSLGSSRGYEAGVMVKGMPACALHSFELRGRDGILGALELWEIEKSYEGGMVPGEAGWGGDRTVV